MFSKRYWLGLPLAAALFVAPARAQTADSAAAPPDPFLNLKAFNPDISAIVDMFYYDENSDEGMGHVAGEIAGFGHVHAESEGEDHHHHAADKGFNLRHLELQFSGTVDPYFKATAIAAIDLDDAEMEVAEIETTCLPFGLKVKGGKFFSDFGYINAQHSHEWDFVDQPLIYQLALGAHGLNDKGVQVSWLAPVPFFLLAGAEAFQGDNEQSFAYVGEGELPEDDGPRVGVGWLKVGPNLPGNHGLQFGTFAATGTHQEEHDGNGDGEADHWLDGDTSFWGADAVYKYNSPQSYGQGDVAVQAEYFSRKKDLDLVAHDLAPHLVGNSRVDEQDGYYVQATYGFLPRWRAGLRWEQVGLTNESELPDGTTEDFGASDRASAMLDFTPSHFSRIRLQANQGSYETADGAEDVTEVFVQWMVSLGAHGAHNF